MKQRESGWYRHMKLGQELAPNMPTLMTYEQIGQELGGLRKQHVYQLAMVALGRLVEQLREKGLA
jgi:hypothetical protein